MGVGGRGGESRRWWWFLESGGRERCGRRKGEGGWGLEGGKRKRSKIKKKMLEQMRHEHKAGKDIIVEELEQI